MAMKGGSEIFFVLLLNCWRGRDIHLVQSIKDYPHQKNWSHTEFVLGSYKQEHLARLFDDILQQVIYKIPDDIPLDETGRTTGISITKRDIKESKYMHLSKAINVATNSSKPKFPSDGMNKTSNNSHISKKKIKEASVLNRSINKHAISADNDTLQRSSKPDIQSRDIPCLHLLHFFEKNIIIVALSVAGIIVAIILLLFVLTIVTRKKRPLYPPANVTYNVFVLSGKTWWQKCQKAAKETVEKYAEKQKQLESSSDA